MSIFEMSKNSNKFSRDGYWTFWLINWHECVNICEFTEHFFIFIFFGSHLRDIAVRVISPK